MHLYIGPHQTIQTFENPNAITKANISPSHSSHSTWLNRPSSLSLEPGTNLTSTLALSTLSLCTWLPDGYSTTPLSCATPAHPDFTEDVNGIRDCFTKLVFSEEKEVVLVVHSCSGIPGAEAPKGVGKKGREGKGLKGGAVRLMFIMALAMLEGFQSTASGAQMPEWMKVNLEVCDYPIRHPPLSSLIISSSSYRFTKMCIQSI